MKFMETLRRAHSKSATAEVADPSPTEAKSSNGQRYRSVLTFWHV